MLCAWLMVTTKALLMLGSLCGHREGTENLGCPAGWKAEHVLLRASAWVCSTMTTRFLCRRLCPLQLVTCILDFTSGRQICGKDLYFPTFFTDELYFIRTPVPW